MSSKATFLLPQPPLHTGDRPSAQHPQGTSTGSHTSASPDLPEKSHLFVFLLIFANDLGGGDAHLHTVHHKPAGPLQGLVVQF